MVDRSGGATCRDRNVFTADRDQEADPTLLTRHNSYA